eukprot:15099752-Ditylum_brightwellii.AAC.1
MLNDMCEQKEAATEQVQTSEEDTKGTRTWHGTCAVGANEDCKKSAVAGSTAKAQRGDKAARECTKSAVKASTAKARHGDDAAKACKKRKYAGGTVLTMSSKVVRSKSATRQHGKAVA